MTRTIRMGCCFCGKAVDDPDNHKLLYITGDGEDDFQQWWAHEECVAAALPYFNADEV